MANEGNELSSALKFGLRAGFGISLFATTGYDVLNHLLGSNQIPLIPSLVIGSSWGAMEIYVKLAERGYFENRYKTLPSKYKGKF